MKIKNYPVIQYFDFTNSATFQHNNDTNRTDKVTERERDIKTQRTYCKRIIDTKNSFFYFGSVF